jgi:putative serine protease PepD
MTHQDPTPTEDDTRRLTDQNTHRFGAGGPSAPPYSYGFPGYPEPARPSRRPGNGVVAAILAAALVVGVLGGLAGAAGFTVVDGLVGGGGASPSTGVVTAPVDNSKNPAAAKGSDQQVAAAVLPSVVKINVSGAGGSGSGSGVILSSDGEILTNNHVVALAGQGGRLSVNFNDGRARPATVLGTDPLTDLAVIKAQNVSGLQPATIDTSGDVAVGQSVLAIGSPFGLQSTVTSGIVSALNRPVSVGETQGTSTTYPAIQTDAAINPGNSGGPLVNMAGEVIGINSSIRTAGSSDPFGGSSAGGSIGLGFAIPIDKVWPVVQQLRKGITPTHARLGVTVTNAQSNNGLLTGAGIRSVNAGSAAQKAGLKRGDVITAVNGEPISGSESLVATIRGHRPGDTVTLTVVSDGSRHQVKVTLDSDNGSAAS